MEIELKDVNTYARLARSAAPFAILDGQPRRLHPASSEVSFVETVTGGPWAEGSHGDPMHKLVMVCAAQIDVEGTSGGWLIPRNHMIFIPMGRPFNLRAGRDCTLLVAHLRAADCAWPRTGCWASGADTAARVLMGYTLRAHDQPRLDTDTENLFLKTLASVCLEWFHNPRMLFLPAAQSESMRAVFRYLTRQLEDANLADACSEAGMTPRTLQRRCEEETTLSWRELVREARTMRAIELLSGGGHSVGEVAKAVGFQSTSAFTTAFTLRMGVSPGAFAKTYSPSLAPLTSG